MIKKLAKVGNSQALILDRTMLEHLGVSEGDSIQVTLDGQSIILNPVVATVTDDQFKESFDRLSSRYDELMRRLAQ